MTFVEAAIIIPTFVCAISIVWLRACMPSDIKAGRLHQEGGLDDVDELRWIDWDLSQGWPPVTCWRGCANFHRDDWGKTYLHQTCWQGCEHLHRDDWWKAYLDRVDQHGQGQVAPTAD